MHDGYPEEEMRFVGRIVLLVAATLLLLDAEGGATDQVERGKYLATVAGCDDCHTPKVPGPNGAPVPDPKRVLAGHPEGLAYPTWTPEDLTRNAGGIANPMLTAWAGPWGVSFGANLTPDKETGIGEWSEATFIRSLRTGKHQGQPTGRDILPPMPVHAYAQMTDADLQAIWAYLRSLPPVKNQVPFPVPPAAAK
jgi:mono/diheme cytochrome c family protein